MCPCSTEASSSINHHLGIVGGQTLQAVSTTHQIPEAAAIIIIALLTMVFALFGYRYVHMYERYTWLPVSIIFLISLGLSAKYMVSGPFSGTGSYEAADILSFGASIAGFGLGWSSLAAGAWLFFRSQALSRLTFGYRLHR